MNPTNQKIVSFSSSGRLPGDLENLVGHYAETIGKPSVFGPGKWSDIHTMAKWAKTSERIQMFITWMELIVNTLPCMECRGHATNFFTSNHPSKYSNYINEEGRNIGMFYWSWIFHNTVNQRLRKPIMDLDVAFSLYPEFQEGTITNTPCTGNCGNETSTTVPTPAPVQTYPVQAHQYTHPSELSSLPIMKSTNSARIIPGVNQVGSLSRGFRPGGIVRK